MPIDLQWEPGGVVRTLTGDVTAEALLHSIAALQNDPRFDALRFVVEDFSGVDSVQLETGAMDMLVDSAIGAALSNPHIRVAVVTSAQQLRLLVRQFAAQSPYITHTFASLAAARAWIAEGDVEPVPLELVLQTTIHS